MKTFILMLSVAVISINASAKIWRINNNPGVVADFSDPQTAHNSPSVLNGDTLYFEASPTNYGGVTLRKRLVLMGLGYFIEAAGNPGLQASKSNAVIGGISYDSLASGSQIIGLEIGSIYGQTTSDVNPGNISLSAFAADNITISRCYISGDINLSTNSIYPISIKADGWKINKCIINNVIYAYGVNPSNWQITNCIIRGALYMSNPFTYNCLVRNNYIGGGSIYNVYFSNNIISTSNITRINCTVKNNTSTGNSFSDPSDIANGNNYVTAASVFVGGPIMDKYYQLLPAYENSAAADGETVNGVTPKRGPFATADPYRLSGIAPIPSIYTFTAPASVASTATTMPVTISTRSNN